MLLKYQVFLSVVIRWMISKKSEYVISDSKKVMKKVMPPKAGLCKSLNLTIFSLLRIPSVLENFKNRLLNKIESTNTNIK